MNKRNEEKLMEKKILVIVPGTDIRDRDIVCYILDSETGECLADHFCSNSSFAYGDLYENRPERIKEWTERFGEFDVKYINETDIDETDLIKKNKTWFMNNKKDQEVKS